MKEEYLKKGERIDQLFADDVAIIQHRATYRYSIDSVLLSRFPRIPSKGLIVDLCAGNGAVGLFVSRKTRAQILAVELQKQLADMAHRSILVNELEEQMQVLNEDLKCLPAFLKGKTVDLLLCNPPYFKISDTSNKTISPSHQLARHEVKTNLEEICCVAQKVLKNNAHFAMVHRPERFLEIIDTLKGHQLTPKRVQFVYPKLHGEAKLLLIEARKNGSLDGFRILPPLFVHKEDGSYTEEVCQLYYGK